MKPKGISVHTSKGSKTYVFRFVIKRDAKLSPYAKYAAHIFRRGVQRAYQDLAHKGVETVIVQNGQIVRGVPRKVAGRFEVAPAMGSKRLARA